MNLFLLLWLPLLFTTNCGLADEGPWVPVSSVHRPRTLDLEVEDYGDIVTAAPPKMSFVVASDLGGPSEGLLPDGPPLEIVTASEWFRDWDTSTPSTPSTTTSTLSTTVKSTTGKTPRRALPRILIRKRINTRRTTTTSTTVRAPSATTLPNTTTTTTEVITTSSTAIPSREPVKPTSASSGTVTVTNMPARIKPISSTSSTRVPQSTRPTTTASFRSFNVRYFTVPDTDNVIRRNQQRWATTRRTQNKKNDTVDGGFVAVPSNKGSEGVRAGREFRDREDPKTELGGTSTNAEKLSYILVGVCCAVSITCLVVVVTVLRCRKVRQRQRALEQLQESRNLTVSWLEKTQQVLGPGGPPPNDGNRKGQVERDPSTQGPQNLWFIRREKLPFLLYNHPVSGGNGGDGSPSVVGHGQGLDRVKKGELIYWTSNNEQLI